MQDTKKLIQRPQNETTQGKELSEWMRTWKLQFQLPSLVMEKVIKIVEDYFQMQPVLRKKEGQISVLYQYNLKLIQTIQKFILHQRKIVQKCNNLSNLYIKSFKAYFQNKNLPFDLAHFKAISPILDTFSMKDWVFHPTPYFRLAPLQPYNEMLLECVRKHYTHVIPVEIDLPQYNELVQQWETEVKSLTVHNMFTVVDLRHKITKLISQYDSHKSWGYQNNNKQFMSDILKAHILSEEHQPEQIKKHLLFEKDCRVRMTKNRIKLLQKFEEQYKNLTIQNADLIYENDNLKKTNNSLETQYNRLQTQYKLLQYKSSVKKGSFLGENSQSKWGLANNQKLEQYQMQVKNLMKQLEESFQSKKEFQKQIKQLIDKNQKETQQLSDTQIIQILKRKLQFTAQSQKEEQSSNRQQQEEEQPHKTAFNTFMKDDQNMGIDPEIIIHKVEATLYAILTELKVLQIQDESIFENYLLCKIIYAVDPFIYKNNNEGEQINNVKGDYQCFIPLKVDYISNENVQNDFPNLELSQIIVQRQKQQQEIIIQNTQLNKQSSQHLQQILNEKQNYVQKKQKDQKDTIIRNMSNELSQISQKYQQAIKALELTENTLNVQRNIQNQFLQSISNDLSREDLILKNNALIKRISDLQMMFQQQKALFQQKTFNQVEKLYEQDLSLKAQLIKSLSKSNEIEIT